MIIPQGRQTDSVITSSSESHDLSHDSEEVVQTPTLDPEMARLENQLDAWCLDLKRNVLVCTSLIPRPSHHPVFCKQKN